MFFRYLIKSSREPLYMEKKEAFLLDFLSPSNGLGAFSQYTGAL